MTENGQATLFDIVKNTAEVDLFVQTVGGYKLQRVSDQSSDSIHILTTILS